MAWRGYAGAAQNQQWQQQAAAAQTRPAAAVAAAAATWAGQQQPRPTHAAVSALKQPVRIAPGAFTSAAPTAAAAGSSGAAGSDTYVVYTKGTDPDEAGNVVVRTLVGEYVEHGVNHGRKVYKKTPDKNGEAVDVFLYYWDGRDGPAFEGWWFGNKLGGTQVWSHCNNSGLLPPSTGWKIPWDGNVRPSLAVAPKARSQVPAAQAAVGVSPEQKTNNDEKLKAASTEVNDAISAARLALEQAKAAAGDYTFHEGLRTAEQALQPQVQALNEALKKLIEVQRAVTPDVSKQFANLGSTLRAIQNSVNTELAKLRASKSKAENSEKQKAADEKDLQALQEVLPEATQKTNAAEDAVEKAVITSEMIAAAGDDMEESQQAVMQTEQAAQEAQKAIGEARIYLNAKQASCRRFESEKAKKLATEELGRLQNQLQEAQNKLNPLKTARQDFAQRAQAQKVVQEVLEKLSPAEVDVDRAEEATVLLTGEGISKEMMAQAEQAVTKAGEHLNNVLRFIDQKKKTLTGLAREELTKMEDRAKASQLRLAQLKASHKEAAERVTCDTLLREAADKLQAVAENVTKAADAEGPFLMGVEELPLLETLSAVKVCETAATAANTAISIARMFIATKLVEAKRFSPGPSQEAQGKLKEFQGELENHTKKLTELKKATALRKKTATLREAESEVKKAEELTKKMAEAASVFEDDDKLMALPSKDIRAASTETLNAERAANAALNEARKFLTAKQIENKGKEMSTEVSAELIKFQTRLTSATTEVAKYKKLAASVEQRLAAKKVIEETAAKIKAAEEKVAKVVELASGLGNAAPSADDKEKAEGETEDKAKATAGGTHKATDQATAEAQVALKTVTRFLESQMRSQAAAKDDLAKLQPQIQQAQEKLDATMAEIRARSEKAQADGLIKESEDKVKDAEEHVQKVSAAEAPFLKDADAMPVEEASAALNELEATVATAHAVVGSAKTFLAMKRLAAKRLAEASSKRATDELASLQTRLEVSAKALSDVRKGLAERKLGTVKREVAAKVEEAEKRAADATEATHALSDGGATMAPLEMKAACEKAGSTQADAQSSLQSAKSLLQNRQKEIKAATPDAAVLADISKMLEKLSKLQVELDKQKNLLRLQEHKFVAERLLKDATDHVEELEKKLEVTTETTAPLTSDKDDFSATVFLSQSVDALKLHLQTNKKTAKQLFEEISEKKEGIPEARFVSFMRSLPEVAALKDALLEEEQLKAAFSRLTSKGGEEVKEEELVDQLRHRYLCNQAISMTDSLSVKGGKTVRKVDIGEVVEALDEPVKDDSVGLMRVRVKAEKDEKEGFVTLAGNQGTIYLEPYLPHVALQRKVEKALAELSDNAKEVGKYIESKTEELKSVKSGPLADTKGELLKLRPRVSKVQFAATQLKKKVADAQKKHGEAIEAEQKRRQEVADKAAAAALIEKATKQVAAVEDKVSQVVPQSEALAASRGADLENPLKAMTDLEKDLDATRTQVEEVLAELKSALDDLKVGARGPFAEVRTQLIKMKVKVGALDSKCKKQVGILRAARKEVASDANAAIVSAFRAHVEAKGLSVEQLLKELSQDGKDIPLERLRAYLEKIPDGKLKASQLDVGLDRYASGITKLMLLEMLQEFQKCVKEIAITTSFQVKESKTIRKLALGELVEVLEAGKVDETAALPRVRCRTLVDKKEGWVTLRGNQGTSFLEKCSKPYYCCEEESAMHSAFESTSAEVRKVLPGEVLEVLEGPLKEPPQETQRVRGKAGKDGKTGWVTLKDAAGTAFLEPAKLLVCRASIAITTAFDIAEGKAIRKLDVGETLDIVEGPNEDAVRSLTRIKAKTRSDGKEGWVTMKGNQGTAYVEETEKHFVCKQSLPLETRLASGSSALRQLEEGEAFEVVDGPKTETKEGANRVKGRNLSDGAEGWFTLSASNFQPWSPSYKVVQSTVLTDGLDIKEGKTARKLDAGELLDALETPTLEKAAGLMRVRVRAEKDGAVGFATIRGNQGTTLLKPVLGEP